MSRFAPYPRVTFGIIVLNGEPFTRYCLRSLYPFAHQIVVVEGGHEGARAACTSDGHSLDDTLAVLRRFKEEEDPLEKIEIVTRDGFWPQKDELGRDRTHQSRAYAARATGDYLWQVDIDEFYRPQDMHFVLSMLSADPQIAAVSFNVRPFWGGLDYQIDGWKWRRGDQTFHRLFKWRDGYRYQTHEPPTVLDERGQDLRQLKWVSGKAMARQGVHLYHYCHVFPSQVMQKTRVYNLEKPEECADILDWAENSYFRLGHPFHVERHYWAPSWLKRYHGDHPPEAMRMMSDVRAGLVSEELRRTDDVDRLVGSRWYGLACSFYAVLDVLDRCYAWGRLQAVRASHVPRKTRAWLARRRR
jgi:hypothetical protein